MMQSPPSIKHSKLGLGCFKGFQLVIGMILVQELGQLSWSARKWARLVSRASMELELGSFVTIIDAHSYPWS